METLAAFVDHGTDVFTEGVYLALHGYLMAVGCFFLASLHFLKSHHDSGEERRMSRIWKGFSFIMLGIGFIVSESLLVDPVSVRRMLRLLVAIVILSEISYHIPFLLYVIEHKWRGKTKSWMSTQSHLP